MAKKPAKKDAPAAVSDVKSKKEDKKAGKKASEEAVLLDGIPDSKYITFKDERWNAFFSAVLGTPGLMAGKVWEIAGKSDAGKTALALQILVELQNQGERIFYVDAERAMTKERALSAGLDAAKVIFAKPDGGEKGFQAIGQAVSIKGAKYGIVDSSSALKPLSMSKNMGNNGEGGGGMAQQARLMSAEMPLVEKVVADNDGLVFFISQIKEKPGVTFGNPEYISSGGSALGFHSRVRISLRKVEVKKDEETKQTNRFTVRMQVTKNHTGPNRTTPFDLVVNHLFQVDFGRTAVAWAKQFNLVDEEASTIAGIPYVGAAQEKNLLRAVEGKEKDVFMAVDNYFRTKVEINKKIEDFEEQADATDELFGNWNDEEPATAAADPAKAAI